VVSEVQHNLVSSSHTNLFLLIWTSEKTRTHVFVFLLF